MSINNKISFGLVSAIIRRLWVLLCVCVHCIRSLSHSGNSASPWQPHLSRTVRLLNAPRRGAKRGISEAIRANRSSHGLQEDIQLHSLASVYGHKHTLTREVTEWTFLSHFSDFTRLNDQLKCNYSDRPIKEIFWSAQKHVQLFHIDYTYKYFRIVS